MPYSAVAELPDAVKKLPKPAQEIYMGAFNGAFEKEDNEGSAHAIAWAAVKTKFKQNPDDSWTAKEAVHPHGEHICVCPECGEETTVAENVKCNTQSCPECETRMRAKDIGERRESKRGKGESRYEPIETLQFRYSEIIQEAGRRNASLDSTRLKKIVELCQELLSSEEPNENDVKKATAQAESALIWVKEQESMKLENGESYPAHAFAHVPDSNKPDGWKLRLWESNEKKITKAQLGRASAALSPGGLSGQKTLISSADLPTVKRTIRLAYRGLGIEESDIPKWVKETETRELVHNFVSLIETKFDQGKAQLIVIKPGFNVSEDRYYPAAVLQQDYGIFEGMKMYADHPTEDEDKARPERSIRDWVATLTEVRCDDKDSVVTGVAEIVEPWLMQKLASLRDKGMLSEMGVSINAVGNASKDTIDGKETLVIEKLIACRSVDFVTEPGAGGVVTFYESDRGHDIDLIELTALKERRPDLVKVIETDAKATITREVKEIMEDKEKITTLEGENATLTAENAELKTKVEEAATAQAKAEAQASIKEAVDKAELPDAAKERLTERFKDAVSADGIAEAIQAETDYIAKLSEAGKVKGMGDTKVDPVKTKEALKESFKKLNPDWTDERIAIAVEG